MNKKIKIASLFSGVGGFEEGLKLAKIDFEVVFASEIDRFAQNSYSSNFETDNLYGDITKINEKSIPDHDLLLAGFPCQSFSIAGKRKGFEDARGTLFYDVARILNEKKPKLFLLENVKNLISHDSSRTIKQMLKILNDLNYTVDFTIINSVESGVPQNRERTYICGIYNFENDKYLPDSRNLKINKLKEKLNKSNFNSFNFFNSLNFDCKQIYIEDIIDKSVDTKYYLDNPKLNEYINNYNIDYGIENEKRIIKILDIPREIHNDLERQRRVYSIKGISPTILARSDSAKIMVMKDGEYKIRKMTPDENFSIQGFDKKFIKNIRKSGISDTQMYKQSGNAVSPPVIAGIVEKLIEEYM